MGGKDTPPLQYASTSPLQSPKWALPSQVYRGSSKSSVDLDMRVSESSPQWQSTPASPEQPAKSPRSSTRSSGTVSPIRQYMECFEPQTLSCALVGDSGVGKTSLLLSYTTGSIPSTHAPTIYDKFSTSISVYGKRIAVTLCDTSGQDDFSHLRPLCYPQLDAVLICFSVINSESYENIKTKWSKEIRKHCPEVPVILVGTQVDQRESLAVTRKLKSRGLRTVSRADGIKLASSIKATTYIECSALKQLNVKNAFDEAIAAALELSSGSRKKSPQCVGGCTIL